MGMRSRKKPELSTPLLVEFSARVTNETWSSGMPEPVVENFLLPDRIAWLIDLFDGQLQGNGLQFWIINGFWKYDAALLSVMGKLEARHVEEVIDLVRAADEIGRCAQLLEEAEDTEHAEEQLDELAGRCEELDRSYSTIRSEFLADVEHHLARMVQAESSH